MAENTAASGHVAPGERLELLVQQRDAQRDAAIALAERDDFDPDDNAYTSLRDRAAALDARIEQLRGLIEQRAATRAVDRRGLRLPTARTTVLGEEDVYRPDGQRSFFTDSWRAQRGDSEAREMLDRHMRAMTTGAAAGGGGNVVPPQYLASLFAPDPKFGSPVAASFPQYALPNGASAFKVPRQLTAGTVADQSGENVAVTPSDQTFDQLTVTPVTKVGATVFSRQLLDGANPAIDQIVASDLRGELLEQIDTDATATMLATSGAGTGTSSGTAVALLQTILAEIPQLYGARKAPADTIYMSPAAFGLLASAVAADGRPLINAYAPQNAFGVGSTADVTTSIGGLPVVLAPHLVDGVGTLTVVIAKRSDFGMFLSPLMQFRFEEKLGPESIEVGVWQYVASLTGRYPTGVTVITHSLP